jgi:hypothetical protein
MSSDLSGVLHCPSCGGTDPIDWHESAGTPTYCVAFESCECAEITEECPPGHDHREDDELVRKIEDFLDLPARREP